MAALDRWSGRLGFILATIGSAVGLGSIWKFPYEVGANGGGVFVVFYLAGLTFIVLPLMAAEFAIGRRGRADAPAAIASVARDFAASPRWGLVGYVGALAAFLILSYYSVIGGWALAYAIATAIGGLGATPAEVQAQFDALREAPGRMALAHAAFMLISAVIVARGIAGGIESAAKLLMPALIVLMVLLAGYSMAEGGVVATLHYLFAPDFSRLTANAALEALGLGFFSIGVGMAVMVTYAAYASQDINLREVAIITLLGDTAISLLAGFAVFPVVFAHGLDPSSGPGLLFVTLPLAFRAMPFGTLAAFGFFILLVIAAIGSAISLLEIQVALIKRERGWSRPRATSVAAGACWLTGLATVLSFNAWRDWFPLAAVPLFERATVFELLDFLTSNLLLPLGGIALALFAGFVIPARFLAEELSLGPRMTTVLRVLLRYVVPTGVAAATAFALAAG